MPSAYIAYTWHIQVVNCGDSSYFDACRQIVYEAAAEENGTLQNEDKWQAAASSLFVSIVILKRISFVAGISHLIVPSFLTHFFLNQILKATRIPQNSLVE